VKRVYAFETWTSSSEMPNDTGAVAVIDGGKSSLYSFPYTADLSLDNVLLTPFRTQNIPPPMSSCKLRLSPSDGSYISTPVYATFAQHRDCLAVLYENGVYRIWELHTRLGPGSGLVMKPEVVQEGVISVVNTVPRSWRQIVFLVPKKSDLEAPRELVLAALGSEQNGKDLVCVNGEDGLHRVEPNGRLVADSPMGSVLWQSPSGEICDG
jgi:elongator complex protein 1